MDEFIPIEGTPVTSTRQDLVEDQTENTSPASPTTLVSPLRITWPFDANNEIQTTTSVPPPLRVTPLQTVLPSDGTNKDSYDAGVGPSTGPTKRGRGRPKGSKNSKPSVKKAKTYDFDCRKVFSCPNFDSEITEAERETGSQEIVDSVLMRFDAVRRRLCQVNHPHILTRAVGNCSNLGVRTNLRKRIGPVPGVQVGDIFYCREEMLLVGLHKQPVAGIEYLTDKDGAVLDGPVATSVVTTGKYDDETEEIDTLIYTGSGGKEKGQACDQKMEDKKGGLDNLALEASKRKGSDVRVTRGKKAPYDNQMIYIYDGLYIVSDVWSVTGKSGFKEFKFKLVRKQDQPNSGYAIWKLVENLRNHDSTDPRQGFLLRDLSFGKELLRVSLVNEVDEDDKNFPEDFEYIRSLYYSSMKPHIQIDSQTLGCQSCRGQSCIDQSGDCMCIQKNDGKAPYHNSLLVCRKPLVYECGRSCPCPNECKTRVVQGGLKLQMEVFKTETRGWGLRSWDPIRAGTFICEFAGVRKTKEEVEAENDYMFDSARVYHRFRWNYEPELVNEDVWEPVPEAINLPTQVLISAKEKGNVSRFMNHSCSPNVFWQPIEYENNADVYVRIGLFAMRHIPPMTELTYDYGVSSVERIGEDELLYNGKKVCLCGSVKCRGSFG